MSLLLFLLFLCGSCIYVCVFVVGYIAVVVIVVVVVVMLPSSSLLLLFPLLVLPLLFDWCVRWFVVVFVVVGLVFVFVLVIVVVCCLSGCWFDLLLF